MADLGTLMTDERMKVLTKRLDEVYNEAYETAVLNHKKALDKLAKLKADIASGKYADLSGEVREKKLKAFANEVIRTERLADKIAREIANAGETAAKIIQGEMTNIYGLNYDFAAYSINRQTEIDLDWTVYDRNQLAVLVQEQQSPFSKIAYDKLGKTEDIIPKLQNQLMQSVLNGESQQKIIRRIKTVTTQSAKQAKRVAQTERTRVQSQGRQMGFDEAEKIGVAMQKQWIARLRNTRELHLKTHLEIVDSGDKFSNGLKFPGDPDGGAANVINCFCVLKPMVKSTSPSLAEHRAWMMDKSFEQFRTLTKADIAEAKEDISHYSKRIANIKELRRKAEKRGDEKAIKYHNDALKKAHNNMKSAKSHLKTAEKNYKYAVEKTER